MYFNIKKLILSTAQNTLEIIPSPGRVVRWLQHRSVYQKVVGSIPSRGYVQETTNWCFSRISISLSPLFLYF